METKHILLGIDQMAKAMDIFGYTALFDDVRLGAPTSNRELIDLATMCAVRTSLLYRVRWERLQDGRIVRIGDVGSTLVNFSHSQQKESFQKMIAALKEQPKQSWLKRLIRRIYNETVNETINNAADSSNTTGNHSINDGHRLLLLSPCR